MNLKYKILNIICLIIFITSSVYSQDCRRQVLSSAGCSATTSSGQYVSWTLGQPLNGCTIGNNVIIRQGFEQPQDDNCIVVSMTWESSMDACDNTYFFEYTGEVADVVSYNWNFGTNASPNSSTEQNPGSVSFSTAGEQNISLTINSSDCESTASNVLDILEVGFGATAVVVDQFCEGDAPGNITISPFGGDGSYSYIWSTGNTTSSIENLSPGEYTLTLSDGTNCSKEIIYVVNGPADFLAVNGEIRHESCDDFGDGFIDLVITGGLEPYEITWGDGTDSTHVDNLSTGIMSVTVTDALDCIIETSFNVGLYCSGIEISNTFTPNGDGTNDIWKVNGVQYFAKNELRIYNRWGSLMYKEVGFHGEWLGVDNSNVELPTGAYYYTIDLNDGKETSYCGSVTIIR